MRGLAAMSVLFFHATQSFFPDGSWLKFLFSEGHLGVEVFFVITGFVIPYSIAHQRNYGYFRFLFMRFFRLFPAYWFSLFVIILVMQLPNIFSQNTDFQWNMNTENILLHIFMLNPYFNQPWFNTAYWSLAVEFQFYVLVGLIFPILLQNKLIYRLIFYCLFAISAFISTNIYCTFYAFLFLPGIAFALFQLQKISVKEFVLVVIACCVLLYFQRHEWTRPLVIALTIMLMFQNKLTYMGSKKISELSYGIYLLHIPMLYFIFPYASKIIYAPINTHILLLITCICTYLLAIFQYSFIEKPFILISKMIIKKTGLK